VHIFSQNSAIFFCRLERRSTVDVLRLHADAKPTKRRSDVDSVSVVVALPDVDAVAVVVPVVSPSGVVPGVSNAVRQGQEEEAGGLVMRTRALLRLHVQERRLPHLQRHR